MSKEVLLFLLISTGIYAQTGIGTTTPHTSAKLEVASTEKGFLPPRMTSLQRGNIVSPAPGLIVYQTDGTVGLYLYNGSNWNYVINSTTNVLPVSNGGTGVTTSTGTESVVLSNGPTINLLNISSGDQRFPSSINITPTTYATSKRAGAWLGDWGLLQDFLGDGTKNFSITQNVNNSTYPSRLFIKTNGNVGIGSDSPSSTLEIGSTSGSVPGYLVLNPTTSGTRQEETEINIKPAPITTTPAAAQTWVIDQVSNNNNPRLRIFPSISGEDYGITIKDGGFVGIGVPSPSVKLQVNGDIIANSIAGSSDLRFKTNIHTVENALDKVKSLRGVYFNWNQKSFPNKDFSDKTELGFIAQEVEKVLPEVVSKDKTPEEYRSVKYDKVVALLVEAIKEQQKQIDSLKSQVKKLKRKKK